VTSGGGRSWRLPAVGASTLRTGILALTLSGASPPSVPQIETRDVERFFALYDAWDGKPPADLLQRDYLDRGTPGLHDVAIARNISGAAIAARIAAEPALYANARRCAAVLPRVKLRLADALARLRGLYPEAKMPVLTIAIGRGKPVGFANSRGAYVGVEALCGWRQPEPDVETRFVHVIAHEYIHVQQQPRPDGGSTTVLEAALMEGGAEFLGELISGSVAYRHLAKAAGGRELEIESDFAADMDARANGSRWVYNGTGNTDRPGDLGYWVGYRIVRSYYRRAPDKAAAIRDILAIGDARAFLAKSGWQPGAA
jgi:hypothetical protein